MTFKELREASGMNKTKFAEYFGIPYRSVQNWELGLRECPKYLLDLMTYKLEAEAVLSSRPECDAKVESTPTTAVYLRAATKEQIED